MNEMPLTSEQAAIIKGMLIRGDKQHDIAARFGVNGGRVAEISTGKTFKNVAAAPQKLLPPSGPVVTTRTNQPDLFQKNNDHKDMEGEWLVAKIAALETRIRKLEKAG